MQLRIYSRPRDRGGSIKFGSKLKRLKGRFAPEILEQIPKDTVTAIAVFNDYQECCSIQERLFWPVKVGEQYFLCSADTSKPFDEKRLLEEYGRLDEFRAEGDELVDNSVFSIIARSLDTRVNISPGDEVDATMHAFMRQEADRRQKARKLNTQET